MQLAQCRIDGLISSCSIYARARVASRTYTPFDLSKAIKQGALLNASFGHDGDERRICKTMRKWSWSFLPSLRKMSKVTVYRKHTGPSNWVKITFQLAQGAWHGSATESLWAEPVGSQTYRLKNVPFYVFGVSFDDVVLAHNINGILLFVRTFSHEGHSTYRLLVNAAACKDKFEQFWKPMQTLGCLYEEGPHPLVAVDVPPEADIFQVYKELESGEAAGVWSFEEGHCGHPVHRN